MCDEANSIDAAGRGQVRYHDRKGTDVAKIAPQQEAEHRHQLEEFLEQETVSVDRASYRSRERNASFRRLRGTRVRDRHHMGIV
jgi:hypothetical protein